VSSKFSYRKTILFGFGFLGISVVWPIFNRFIPLFLQAGNPAYEQQLLAEGREIPNIIGFGLAPSLAFFIMTWDNLINVFVQPWVGARSDQTWNRFGRRKGWILLGLPIALIGFIAVPYAASVLAIALFILITNFGMALFRSPTVAWLGDLIPPEHRGKANGAINLMGGIGFVIASFVLGGLFDSLGRPAPFLGGAIVLVVALLIPLIWVEEPEQVAAATETKPAGSVWQNLRQVVGRPDKSAVMVLLGIVCWSTAWEALDTGLSSIAVFTLGIAPGQASMLSAAGGLAFLLFAIPAGMLGEKYGRGRVIRLGLIGAAILLPVSFLLVNGAVLFVVCVAAAGIMWSLINVNALPLVYDHGEEDKIGAYTGLYYFSSQSAAVLGPVLGGVLVSTLSDQHKFLFLFSAFWMALGWLVMRRVR
jgi:maltose/moltooligosaccharide transporter